MTSPLTSQAVPLAGVLGWPISHSLSPLLHGHWIEHLGLKAHYVPLGCPPSAFQEAVPALLKTGFVGFNVTVPHKEAAANLCDVLTSRAEAMGSVNTLWCEEGRLHGDSTDGLGFLSALPALAPGQNGVVIGAGGSAKAIVYALAQEAGLSHITIANRSTGKAEALCNAMAQHVPHVGFEAMPLEAAQNALHDKTLIVNTTSLGMTGQPPLVLDLQDADPNAIVYDIIYTPAQTPLLKTAQAAGLTTMNGLAMLIGQARPGFARWFGVDAPVTGQEEDLLTTALGTASD